MLRDYVEEACDTIDAALYSGDAFDDYEQRQSLLDWIERWQPKLAEIARQKAKESQATDA